MADTQEQYEKKVHIALEASMKGFKEALAVLEAMSKHSGLTGQSLQALSRIEKLVERSTKSVAASFNKYTNQLTTAEKAQKSFYKTGHAMGSIIRTATKGATAGMSALGVMIKRTGDTMVQFETVSIHSGSAIKRLQDWDLWLTMLKNGKYGAYCDDLIFETKVRKGITYGENLNPHDTFEEAERAIKQKHKFGRLKYSVRV